MKIDSERCGSMFTFGQTRILFCCFKRVKNMILQLGIQDKMIERKVQTGFGRVRNGVGLSSKSFGGAFFCLLLQGIINKYFSNLIKALLH